MEELTIQAKQILEKIPFMHIATVGNNGFPLNSPVKVGYDKNYTFFWNSSPQSEHSKNIRKNQNVFVVISDYEIKRAVYMSGKAHELNDEKEIEEVIKMFEGKVWKPARSVSDVVKESPRRMYKFIPEKFYTNTYEKLNELPNDQRVEIYLK